VRDRETECSVIVSVCMNHKSAWNAPAYKSRCVHETLKCYHHKNTQV